MITRVLVPSGVLGLGFSRQALARALERKPDIIAIDGGSTDSGPYYLGTGTSKYAHSAVKAEWRDLMKARAKLGIPLIIGSAGTCGSDAMVDAMFDITCELAKELGQKPKVALLYSEQKPDDMANAFKAGKIKPLEPPVRVDEQTFIDCEHIVALAGVEQIGAALQTGADIVIAGRTTDTAVIAALPLMREANAGAAWHGAKIGECGALCSTDPKSGCILIEFDSDGFTVEPSGQNARCTPRSVSAHMLYENSDPFELHEPGGTLDVREAIYEPLDERSVRVTGSIWRKNPTYTVKLEGALATGYQTTILAIIRDERYVENAQIWVEELHAFLTSEIKRNFNLSQNDYTLEFRLIGINAALGDLETRNSHPNEVGVLGIITAQTQQMAAEIGKMINPHVLHYPLPGEEEMPSFAFPYSPAQSDRGALYEFCLNHVMALSNPMQAFRLVTKEAGV